MKALSYIFSVTAIIAIISSCSIEPKEIMYGKNDCHYCKMHIVDRQHAAEIVTNKGKVHVYDATECMLNDMSENDTREISLYLTNVFSTPSKLFDATAVTYIISEALPSPMGENLTAFETRDEALDFTMKNGGVIYNWDDLVEQFNSIRKH